MDDAPSPDFAVPGSSVVAVAGVLALGSPVAEADAAAAAAAGLRSGGGRVMDAAKSSKRSSRSNIAAPAEKGTTF